MIQKSEQQERQTSITEEEQSYTQATPGNKRETPVDVQKVMGVHWNFLEYLLVLPHCQGCCSRRTDQQRCCECVSKVLRSLILFKLLLQRIWKIGLDWDEHLSGKLFESWKKLVSELKQVPPTSVTQNYFEGAAEVKSCSQRGFCDASSKAYAVEIYLKVETIKGV